MSLRLSVTTVTCVTELLCGSCDTINQQVCTDILTIEGSTYRSTEEMGYRQIVLSLVYEKRALRFQSSKIDLIPVLESLKYILSGSTCFQNAILLSNCGC